MSNEYMVTVFNTVTARYEEIAVSKEIYNEYRRGEWRISKNNDKHSTGEIPFCALTGGEDGGYENFHEFVDTEHTVEAMLAKQEERRLARPRLGGAVSRYAQTFSTASCRETHSKGNRKNGRRFRVQRQRIA